MGILSVGKLRLHQPSHLILLILMIGILFGTRSLAQLQRNTASKNIWRRQSPLPADEEPAPLHLWRRQSDDDAAAAPPADDASAATSDPTNANPAENEINAGGNAVGRQAINPAPPGGNCYSCDRSGPSYPGSPVKPDCLGKAPDPATSQTVPCFPKTLTSKPEEVRCVTILVEMKGTRDKAKSKIKEADMKERRVEYRTCMEGENEYSDSFDSKPKKNYEDVALEHLNLKLEDGKCIKGTYSLKAIYGLYAARFRGDLTALEDSESTDPEPGKPRSLDAADYGLFYGYYGREQYADLTICVCKEEKCNKETMSQLKSAGEASPAARLLRLLPA